MGPPTEPPNWFRLNFGVEVAKSPLASKVGVAHELIERAVEVVRSRFRRDQNGRSGPGAVFGGVGVSENLELLNVVDRGENADAAGRELIIIDAVKQPIRAVGARSAHRQRVRTARGNFAVGAGVEKAAGISFCRGAGGERGQLNEVAPVQRQLRHLLRGNDLAERWVGRLDGDRLAGDRYGRGYARRREREIELAGLINLEPQIFRHGALKSGCIDFNVVCPHGEKRDQIVPGTVGLRVAHEASALRSDGNGGAGDRRSGFVVDIAVETPRGLATQAGSEPECEYADCAEENSFERFCPGRRIHKSATIRADLNAFHLQTPFG